MRKYTHSAYFLPSGKKIGWNEKIRIDSTYWLYPGNGSETFMNSWLKYKIKSVGDKNRFTIKTTFQILFYVHMYTQVRRPIAVVTFV